jgi:hypothetical protein
MSIRHADRLMLTARTVEALESGPVGPVPVNERQARPLTKLAGPVLQKAWKEAVETAPAGRVTAAHVERVVRTITGEDAEQGDPVLQVPANSSLHKLKGGLRRESRYRRLRDAWLDAPTAYRRKFIRTLRPADLLTLKESQNHEWRTLKVVQAWLEELDTMEPKQD